MADPKYLSTDPNAGQYLSSDPNAGEPITTSFQHPTKTAAGDSSPLTQAGHALYGGTVGTVTGAADTLYNGVKNFLTGNAMGSATQAANMVKSAVQPLATVGRGAYALATGDLSNIPTDQEWNQAAQGAGAQLTTALAPKLTAPAGKVLGAVTPSAESMMTRAANLRAPAEVPQVFAHVPGVPISIPTKVLAPAVNAARRGAASVLETGARAASKFDRAPVPTEPGTPVSTAPSIPSTPALGYATEAGPQFGPKPAAGPANPVPMQQEVFAPPNYEAAPVNSAPRYQMPAEPGPAPIPDYPAAQSNPIPMANPPDLSTSTITPQAITHVEQQINPLGAGKLSTLRNTPKLLQEIPELATKQGAEFDRGLLDGLNSASEKISQVEDSIPKETTIEKAPIVKAWTDLKEEYAGRGLVKSTRSMEKLLDLWNELPSSVPWDQFLALKRGFFREIADAKSSYMRRAYGELMKATSELSPELADANSSYSTIRKAVDDAKLDPITGRRIRTVGKQPTPPPSSVGGRRPLFNF